MLKQWLEQDRPVLDNEKYIDLTDLYIVTTVMSRRAMF